MLAGTGVGGGTLINWMTCIEAPEDVRAGWETEHGLEGMTGDAWTTDVASHRIRARRRRVHAHPAQGRDHPARRTGARLGGRPDATQRRRLRRLRQRAGSAARAAPSGRGSASTWPRRTAAGARVIADATVTRVILEGGRAVGVEATVAGVEGGAPRSVVVRAQTVVVAAGALRTPAILQATGLEHPHIGRHLRLHPVPVMAGRFSEEVEMWRGHAPGRPLARILRAGTPVATAT